ncbi:PAS domain S-box protein [Biomaibacter acetigenes]|uniref:PAS domain S-box protein n=1 Tax=Biomaibacter acetigenes TaxID=2316383 RepID=A0A3G2R6T8_9FIRM|nr:sigma 54-interacting transcriptional regulator [Biomaibacter acetigenes]AYO31085.1 PAS domain S-box protein [Biomaibacter acetigenes]
MNNILLIAPYEELEKTAKEVVMEHGLQVDVIQGNLSDGSNIAKRAEEKGVEVIISRGGTYQSIKNVVNIPVIEIQVSAFDILRALKDLLDYRGPIGIVGYENVVFGIDTLIDVLGLDLIRVIFKNEEEAPRQVYEVASKGVREFVGDTIGIKTVKSMGFRGRLIESGKEAVLSAIYEARRVLEIRREERARAERFKVIMDFIHDGIIAVDEKGYITIFNKTAGEIFNKSDNPVGKHVSEVVETTKLPEVLKSGEPQLGELQRVGNVVIATNRVPIIVDGEVKGAVATFQDVTQIQKMEQKIRRELHQKGLVAKYSFKDIVHKSRIMEDLICRARKYAELDSTTVLILGETGTGKELFAHSIHNESPRAKGPFVAINCAALPENLLESELFGYAEGAFTGARRGGKIGLFEMAHMGTIFLDEIGDMPLNLQSRLLRVIQEKEVMRIGDDRVIPVDVRIIASTNRNLEEDIEKGAFRRDLFYRLNVLKLIIPPLRERKEDIPLLVDLFVEKYSSRLGKKVNGITQKARDLLMNLDYSGNVRELKGVIERAVAFAESEYIKEADLGISNQAAKQNDAISRDIFKGNFTLKEIEIMAIREALAKTRNNISEAARLLGVDRTTIWRKIKESGLTQ